MTLNPLDSELILDIVPPVNRHNLDFHRIKWSCFGEPEFLQIVLDFVLVFLNKAVRGVNSELVVLVDLDIDFAGHIG